MGQISVRPSPLTTKSLLFLASSSNIGGDPGDNKFWAYDKKTGKIVATIELPGKTSGAPMSYSHNGRQYIALALSAQGQPAELVALALPGARVTAPAAAPSAAATAPAERVDATAAQLAMGQQVYADRCAACHGAQGQGVPGGSAPALRSTASLNDVKNMITRGSAEMPGLAAVLTPEQIDAAARFVKVRLAAPASNSSGRPRPQACRRGRYRKEEASMRVISIPVLIVAAGLCAFTAASAQVNSYSRDAYAKPNYDGYAVPKNGFGQPDFAGVWSNATTTPVERPAEFKDRLVLTEVEASRVQGTAETYRRAGDVRTDPSVGAPTDKNTNLGYNRFWTDPGTQVMRVHGEPRSSFLTTPDGRVPPKKPGAPSPQRRADLSELTAGADPIYGRHHDDQPGRLSHSLRQERQRAYDRSQRGQPGRREQRHRRAHVGGVVLLGVRVHERRRGER
jgi:mono/diheme cytochrome c family protein